MAVGNGLCEDILQETVLHTWRFDEGPCSLSSTFILSLQPWKNLWLGILLVRTYLTHDWPPVRVGSMPTLFFLLLARFMQCWSTVETSKVLILWFYAVLVDYEDFEKELPKPPPSPGKAPTTPSAPVAPWGNEGWTCSVHLDWNLVDTRGLSVVQSECYLEKDQIQIKAAV